MQSSTSFVVLLLASGVLSSQNTSRLPNTIQPQHYELRILTHLNGPEELGFEGNVTIDILVLEQTNNITLHAKNLTIDETQITLSSNDRIMHKCIVKIELLETEEFYIMHLCKVLQQSESYQLFMPFKGKLNGNETGYYWSSFNDSQSDQTHYLAVTQFSPTFARLAFPCFDEPHLKATFRLTLGYQKDYTGLSNTPVKKCNAHEILNNYVWCEHEPLFRTSTYLVAYAVHNLSSISIQTNNVSFHSWMQPKVLGKGKFLANFAPKVLSYLENLLDYDYPLHKIDQLAVPTHKFSAMENWGLLTFKESSFVHDDNEEMLESKQRKVKTMAHEYVHQWFGNLVTMKWWNDLWLKEGPSTYLAYVAVDALIPEWGCGERSVANDLRMFFHQDAINNTVAISSAVDGSKNILKQFSPYVYEKGSLTMRMLHKVLGDEAFFKGIRNYVRRYAYDSVTQSDLWQVLQEAGPHMEIPLSTVMNSWTLQKGYPLVSVVRDYGAASVRINQTRFWLSDGIKDAQESCWWIPLTFVTQKLGDFNETQPQFWLKCPRNEYALTLPNKPSSDEWILLNPQVNTIYRVNYDPQNWRLIIKTLNTSQNFGGIHVLNRAQLLDDLMALAWINLHSYELAFSLLEYLPHEQEYIPWKRIIDILNRHGDLLCGEEAKVFGIFMKQLVAERYQRNPKLESRLLESTSNKSIDLYRLMYSQACRYANEDCISQALGLSLANNDENIPVNFRDIIYCTNIEHGYDTHFQQMMQRFQNSTIEARQQDWAIGLGCSRNFTQLEQFLDYLLNATKPSIKSFYIPAITSALRYKYVALETTKHILEHAKIINDKFSVKNIKTLLITMIDNQQISMDELEKLRKFDKFEESLEYAQEMLNVNQNWLTKRSAEFIRVLKKYI